MKEFISKYPGVEICGKSNELYKLPDVVQFVKDTQNTTYDNLEKMQKQLVNPLNGIYAKYFKLKKPVESYVTRVTPSYINVRYGPYKKCRFAIWYKYEKNSKDEPIQIKWFRTINHSHDLIGHKLKEQS